MNYIDGYVMSILTKDVEAYRRLASNAADVWIDHGALEYSQCITDEAPGFTQHFSLNSDEAMLLCWIVYKSREDRDRINAEALHDPRIARLDPKTMPFNGERLIFGGFKPLVYKASCSRSSVT